MAITLKAMIDEMQSGAVFSCVVISMDKKRNTGGEILEYPQARLFDPKKQQAAKRAATEVERMRERLANGKRPNHGTHFTRNIQLMMDGHPTSETRKIHPPLVVLFNNETVLG